MISRTRRDCCIMLLHYMTTNLSLLLLLFLLFGNDTTITTTSAVKASKTTKTTKNKNHPIQCFLDITTSTSCSSSNKIQQQKQKQRNLLVSSLSKWWTQSPSVTATTSTTRKNKQNVYNRNSNSNCCYVKNNDYDDDSSSTTKKSKTKKNHSKTIVMKEQKSPPKIQQKRRRFLQQFVKTVAVLYTSTKVITSSNVNAVETTIASTSPATSTRTGTGTGSTVVIPTNLYQFETAGMIPRVYFEENKFIYGYVERVIDGDTIRITHVPYYEYDRIVPEPLTKRGIADCTISIRLYGIDTPEIAKKKNETSMPYAIDAKQYASTTILHKMIKVTLLQKDKYGRAIGAIETISSPNNNNNNNNSIDVSIELAKRGLAELYTGGNAQYWNKKTQLQQAVAIAKRNKVGIWSLGDSYISIIADYKRNLQKEKSMKN